MDKALTWVGPFEGTGAYPTINRHLSVALERRGWRVLRNQHNDGGTITSVCIAHIYPPRAVNLHHEFNIALTAWEFAGEHGVPRSFIEPLRDYDLVCAPAHWTASIIEGAIHKPVHVVPWGFDPDEFTPEGDKYPFNIEGKIIVLWAGGTDKRHGFDVALKVIDALPEAYHLVAKQSAHYPAHPSANECVTIIRDDLPSMAPLYRAADVFLHSARGVGFGLHVLEAIACGLQVASTPLSPVFDFDAGTTAYSEISDYVHFDHHLHTDCVPKWHEPDVESLSQCVKLKGHTLRLAKQVWRDRWTWDASAEQLEGLIERLRVRA